ncbi:hypothetical protein DOTSEDRAFT_20296 [Dothistroma septosporum NZE10]|uniref:Major facilitator superfamily (MFS) profile domain-containing protein n=1 Tax=Dothistroma septosporum (strain NZE10 / CBS 128990) TaxID=675120 RepID=N1Q4U0_DOTSN|nr:hypothetical protein DOTSEDRAFT_20296 [Dothistroma septosporum NZE10]
MVGRDDNWVTYGLSLAGRAVAWRGPLALQFMFIVPYATVPWLLESPHWLLQKDRVEDAEQIPANIEQFQIQDPYDQDELNEINFTTA